MRVGLEEERIGESMDKLLPGAESVQPMLRVLNRPGKSKTRNSVHAKNGSANEKPCNATEKKSGKK